MINRFLVGVVLVGASFVSSIYAGGGGGETPKDHPKLPRRSGYEISEYSHTTSDDMSFYVTQSDDRVDHGDNRIVELRGPYWRIRYAGHGQGRSVSRIVNEFKSLIQSQQGALCLQDISGESALLYFWLPPNVWVKIDVLSHGSEYLAEIVEKAGNHPITGSAPSSSDSASSGTEGGQGGGTTPPTGSTAGGGAGATQTGTRAPVLAKLDFSNAQVQSGTPAVGSASLSGTVTEGSVLLTVTSGDPSVATIPSNMQSIQIGRGFSSRPVVVQTVPVTSQKTVTITASAGGVQKSFKLTLLPGEGRGTGTGVGDTGNSTGGASGGGNSAGGSGGGNTTGGNASSGITNRLAVPTNGIVYVTTPVLARFMTTKESVEGGSQIDATVLMNKKIQQESLTIRLSSSDEKVIKVPRTVVVPVGTDRVSFKLDLSPVTAQKTVTLTALLDQNVKTVNVWVQPPPPPKLATRVLDIGEAMQAGAKGARITYDHPNLISGECRECSGNTVFLVPTGGSSGSNGGGAFVPVSLGTVTLKCSLNFSIAGGKADFDALDQFKLKHGWKIKEVTHRIFPEKEKTRMSWNLKPSVGSDRPHMVLHMWSNPASCAIETYIKIEIEGPEGTDPYFE